LDSASSSYEAVGCLLIAGLGLGFTMANYVVAGQNVVSKKMMGVASSTLTLFRTLGGTIGVTVLGVVVNKRFSEELGRSLPLGSGDLASGDISTLGSLLLGGQNGAIPPAVIEAIRTALSESIVFVFLVSAFVVLAAFVITLFIRSVPLRSKEELTGIRSAMTGRESVADPADGNDP
jgi:hypothetical protein